MELDELKQTWDQFNDRILVAETFNQKTLKNMKGKNIRSRFRRILLPELAGSLVSLVSAIYVLFNFHKLHGPAYQVSGALTIVLLCVLPCLGLLSVMHLYRGGQVSKPYVDVLREFALEKRRFCRLQKANLFLSYLLLVTTILILPGLFDKKGATGSKYFFVFAFSFGYSFLLLFSRWVFKKYNTTIRQAEELLHDLAF